MKTTYIKFRILAEMVARADAGLNAPKTVAYGYDVYNRPLVAFLKTDKETGHPVLDVNGNVGLNWRAQKAQTQAAAQ